MRSWRGWSWDDGNFGGSGLEPQFRRALREIIKTDTLPDYRMTLDDEKDQVIFYTRDPKKLAASTALARRFQ